EAQAQAFTVSLSIPLTRGESNIMAAVTDSASTRASTFRITSATLARMYRISGASNWLLIAPPPENPHVVFAWDRVRRQVAGGVARPGPGEVAPGVAEQVDTDGDHHGGGARQDGEADGVQVEHHGYSVAVSGSGVTLTAFVYVVQTHPHDPLTGATPKVA